MIYKYIIMNSGKDFVSIFCSQLHAKNTRYEVQIYNDTWNMI